MLQLVQLQNTAWGQWEHTLTSHAASSISGDTDAQGIGGPPPPPPYAQAPNQGRGR